jgi:hypothetical protein
VQRQDHVRARRDHQVAPEVDRDAARAHALDLAAQVERVDDHAVGDHVDGVRVADRRRDQVQHHALAVVQQRVPGVVSAAVADHDVGVLGEEVDDLALALVAPEQADDTRRGHSSGRL